MGDKIKIREPGHLGRRLVIDGQEWQWVCGKSNVKLRSPHGETKVIDHATLLGIPWYRLEKMEDGYPVLPSDIERYARKFF